MTVVVVMGDTGLLLCALPLTDNCCAYDVSEKCKTITILQQTKVVLRGTTVCCTVVQTNSSLEE